jgi:2-C-methyl-D-erythritol 4-phosphate cytidylyltransferase/2-C-methyl-D-erythritol 2,4-cyclodiphosphate synthase
LPVVDSLAVAGGGGLMTAAARREDLRRAQTPQAFRFADILAAHQAWTGEPDAGDDAQVARAAGFDVALVDGDERIERALDPRRKTYVHVIRGSVEVNGQRLDAGDAAKLVAERALTIARGDDAEVLVFDLAP